MAAPRRHAEELWDEELRELEELGAWFDGGSAADAFFEEKRPARLRRLEGLQGSMCPCERRCTSPHRWDAWYAAHGPRVRAAFRRSLPHRPYRACDEHVYAAKPGMRDAPCEVRPARHRADCCCSAKGTGGEHAVAVYPRASQSATGH